MNEVCILHAADSEPFARKVAAQLAADGYSVVRRDATAPRSGDRRLSDAVIVVWSEAMLAAASMIDAARRALARRILVPVAVGDVAPPASFAHLMPIDLKDWSGDIDDPRWQFVREEVDLARRRGELAREAAPEPVAKSKRRARAPLRAALMIAGAGVLGVAAAVGTVVLAGLLPGLLRQDTDGLAARAPASENRPQAEMNSDVSSPAAYVAAQEAVIEAAPAPIEIPPPPILAHMTVIEPSAAETTQDRLDPPGDAARPAAEAEAAVTEAAAQSADEVANARAADAAARLPVDLSKLPRPVADDFTGAVFRDCAQCPDMAEIPAGIPGTASIEQPFAMARREIRFSDWDACVAEGGCARKPSDEGWGTGARPVIDVSFADAESYVAWLSEKTGRRYRLPTGAEWRYAAQSPPAGANLAGALDPAGPGLRMTVPAGSFASSVLGLYDMRGNVAEWMSDCVDRAASQSCAARLVAGGSFATPPGEETSATPLPPTERRPSIGFRVVRDLP